MRLALSKQRVEYAGKHIRLPMRPDGRALKLVLKPQVEVPIYLAAIGPRNVRLAGEIAAR